MRRSASALQLEPETGTRLGERGPSVHKWVMSLIKSKKRVSDHGEVFTPEWLVDGILDIAMAGTSATLLARKWESALLVNVDNDTLRRIMDILVR